MHRQSRNLADDDLAPEDLIAEFRNDEEDRATAALLGQFGDDPMLAVDIVVGGPPCPTFTRVGRAKLREVYDNPQAHLDDPRASLWVHYLRYVEKLAPVAVLMENVPDFLNFGGRNLGQDVAEALARLGYSARYTLLNAASYGVPQLRERFFLIARKDGRPIRWPTPTHSRNGTDDMFGVLPKWRAAREIIDWSDLGTSLLDRAKPLSLKTRLRIGRGLQRFGGQLAPLYIRLLDLPPDDEATLIGGCAGQVARAFVFGNRNNAVPKGEEEPIPTVTTATAGVASVITPGFGEAKGQQPRVHALDEPVPTISAQGHLHLATATLEAIRAAVGTVDPRRLVVIDGVLHLLDIRFRMLKNEELAAAMGFPPDYEFTGTKSDITKQIGNAVCVNLAAALVGAILEPETAERLAS